tara:strand:+ start:251 stop:568 length:318 start_codon:yes stop_codon:yes gene_type:complete
MAYTDPTPFKIPRRYENAGGVNPETITVNKTLTYTDSQYQLLKNTTGSLDVILPSPSDGASFWIKSRSSSSSNIVVKDADGNTLSTLSAGQSILVVSTDSAWWDV